VGHEILDLRCNLVCPCPSRIKPLFAVSAVGMRATRLRYFVHAGAPHGHRHLIVHRLMWASKIVKGHPRTYVSPRLAAVGVSFQMYFFIFDRAPQPFDENVIHEPAASVHRNRDASGFAGEGGAGELRALIGVEYSRLPVSEQSLLKRFDAKAAVDRVRQPPGQNRAASPIDDRHRDIGDVGRLHMVRFGNRQAAQR
jgi:hypothetical protein